MNESIVITKIELYKEDMEYLKKVKRETKLSIGWQLMTAVKDYIEKSKNGAVKEN